MFQYEDKKLLIVIIIVRPPHPPSAAVQLFSYLEVFSIWINRTGLCLRYFGAYNMGEAYPVLLTSVLNARRTQWISSVFNRKQKHHLQKYFSRVFTLIIFHPLVILRGTKFVQTGKKKKKLEDDITVFPPYIDKQFPLSVSLFFSHTNNGAHGPILHGTNWSSWLSSCFSYSSMELNSLA